MNNKYSINAKICSFLIISAMLILGFASGPALADTCSAITQQSFVSDSSTSIVSSNNSVVVGGNAIPTYNLNPGWTASIPGATWIWSSYKVNNPDVDETVVFQKNINITGSTISSATLYLAADNGARVMVNGNLVFQSSVHDTNPIYSTFSATTQKSFNIAPYLRAGSNTLTFEITNYALPGYGPELNPAGLLYRVDVSSANCTTNINPTVTTNSATSVATSSATLNGLVNGNGISTYAWFEYGTTNSLGYSTSQNIYGPGSTNYSANISGLSPNTTYYFRAVAQNSQGTVYGNILSFTTGQIIQPTMSGTLTPATQTCSIPSGANTCTINFTWNTVNPVATSAVTTDGGATVGNGNSGSAAFTIPFGSKTFYLYNNAILLDNKTVNGVCASGTTWNGNACAQNQTQNNPSVNISANPQSVSYNGSSIISWSSSNATSCTGTGGANGWSGSRNTSGTFNTGSLTTTTSFGITCTNSVGSANDLVTVSVGNQENGNNNPTGGSPITNNNNNTNNNTNNNIINFPNFPTYPTYPTYQPQQPIVYQPTYPTYPPTTYQPYPYVQNPIPNNQPTVGISADSETVTSGDSTFIRWYTNNASYCNASGGSIGWSGPKDIGPGSFFTGNLYSSQTYTITCTNNFGSATDSVTVNIRRSTTPVTPSTPRSALLLVTSSVNRNQPIVPSIDNTRPHPGDEINYTVSYQNVGNGSVSNLAVQIPLPGEVDYISATPITPNVLGNTVIFNLGTLRANASGQVSVRVRVRDSAPLGAFLNFPATLSYVDPSGSTQTVNANVSAQVWGGEGNVNNNQNNLGANVFGAGFLPNSLFGWLFLIILGLLLVLLARYVFTPTEQVRYLPAPGSHEGGTH